MPVETPFESILSQAVSAPDAVAIQARDQEPLRYSDLCDHVRRVIASLNELGISRRDRVVLVLPNRPTTATAALSVLSGATCVPLNPEYKAEEFGFFFESLEASLLLTEEGMDSPARLLARSAGIPVVDLIPTSERAGLFTLGHEGRRIDGSSDAILARSGDVALILPTSGSTARPKLVPLTQEQLTLSARNIVRALKLSKADGALNLMPLFHIGGLLDLLIAPLSVGGRVVVSETGFTAAEFFECSRAFRPTWAQAVPTMIHDLVDHFDVSESMPPSSLRFLRSVSAPLAASLQVEFERTFGIPVVEIYGMTETAGQISGNPPDGERKTGSVGPAAGPEVGIVEGEVVVRGPTVMSGYLNATDDRSAFIDGWLRTGDAGYLDQDGYLFLTGRLREIINRGGEKVSPGEVDAALLSHPAVRDAATYPVPHVTLGEDVAAAVVLEPGSDTSDADLIRFVSERVAYFKVPRTITRTDVIPRTAGGKLRRFELTEKLGNGAPGPEPPTTALAAILAEMWSRVLKVDGIHIHDHFFELGGDSLRAASFVNEIQERWGETVYVFSIFDAPTLDQFGKHLEREYPELVRKMLDRPPLAAGEADRVTPEVVSLLRGAIARPPVSDRMQATKNPRAVFILSPPRSGSTLLRVMLAGSPDLFAPPELFLLPYENLSDRRDGLTGPLAFSLEGNLRALVEARNESLDVVQRLMRGLEDRATPTAEYYGMLQEWIGDRLLVDKTPSYAVHGRTLERAEALFESPLYVHLVRHPYGMIRSFEEARLEQIWYPRLVGVTEARRSSCPFTRRVLGEMIWLILHENIRTFLASIPAERRLRIRFEDLVSAPEEGMRRLSSFLGVPYHPRMLEPQGSRGERMTDGLHDVSRMVGDMKFHRHERIDASVADRWKEYFRTDFLSEATWALARRFGYEESVAGAAGREELVL
jgi:oxalate---CoA ligase